jgi:hypothetical protein
MSILGGDDIDTSVVRFWGACALRRERSSGPLPEDSGCD